MLKVMRSGIVACGVCLVGVSAVGCGDTSSPTAGNPISGTVNLTIAFQFPNPTLDDATQLVTAADIDRIEVEAFSASDVFPYDLDITLDPENPVGILPEVPIGAELEVAASAFEDNDTPSEEDDRILATGTTTESIGRQTESISLKLSLTSEEENRVQTQADLEDLIASVFPANRLEVEEGEVVTLTGAAVTFGNGIASEEALTLLITNGGSARAHVFSAEELGCPTATAPGGTCGFDTQMLTVPRLGDEFDDEFLLDLVFRDGANLTYEFAPTVIVTAPES